MPCLMLRKTDGTIVQQWNLREHPLTVGRGAEADAQVDDHEMSRLHFVIQPRGNFYVIVDQESKNGTELNGQRITEVALKAGDWIRAGQSVFVYDEGLSTVIRRMEEEDQQFDSSRSTPARRL